MSMQDITKGVDTAYFQSEISNSLTIQEPQSKKLLQIKVDKGILYDTKDMKYSIYDETKQSQDSPH